MCFNPVNNGDNTVHIGIEICKATEITPHVFQIRMKNMRPVFVNGNPVLVFIVVYVTADMVFSVNNQNVLVEF